MQGYAALPNEDQNCNLGTTRPCSNQLSYLITFAAADLIDSENRSLAYAAMEHDT